MTDQKRNGPDAANDRPAETHNQKRSRFYSDVVSVTRAAMLALVTFVRGLA